MLAHDAGGDAAAARGAHGGRRLGRAALGLAAPLARQMQRVVDGPEHAEATAPAARVAPSGRVGARAAVA